MQTSSPPSACSSPPSGYVQIERKTETLSDADFIALVQKEVKKRRDSVEQYEKGGRPELAAKEKQEIVVLEAFLPQALSPEELEQLVKATIQEVGATSKKDMGPVIKAVQAKLLAAPMAKPSAHWLANFCPNPPVLRAVQVQFLKDIRGKK